MNKKILEIFLTIFIISNLISCKSENEQSLSDESGSVQGEFEKSEFSSIYKQFYIILIQYKTGFLNKNEVAEKFNALIKMISEYYNERSDKIYFFDDWVFPLKGYGHEQIGGTNGSGFVTDGSDFFDDGASNGHPAHDIFIYDDNQDNLDDRTNKPVEVLSMTGGVVISTKESWASEDSTKGGKFVWIYDPGDNAIFYYAHNRKIFVEEGDVVKPGDVIAEVGRTGDSAFESRSPTHLHLGMFKIENGIPKPHDYYLQLIKAKQM